MTRTAVGMSRFNGPGTTEQLRNVVAIGGSGAFRMLEVRVLCEPPSARPHCLAVSC